MEQLIFIKKSGILTEQTSYILSKPIKTGDILFVGLDDCAYNKVMLVYSNNSTSGVITGTYGNQIDCLFTTLISIIGDKLYINASYGNFTKIANINVYRLSLI